MQTNKQLKDLHNKYEFENFSHLQNHGIDALKFYFKDDLAKVLKLFYKTENKAPDEDLESIEDLFRVANLVSREHKMPGLYSSRNNRKQSERMRLKRRKLRGFLKSRDSMVFGGEMTDGLLKKKFNPKSYAEEIRLKGHYVYKESDFYSIDEEFQIISSASAKYSEKLFEHILPIDSLEKKVEAIRVYESVRNIRNLVDFLFHQRSDFYKLKSSTNIKESEKEVFISFIIWITINFTGEINGGINSNGELLFHRNIPVLSGLNITKIQECKICGKFLWVEKGKVNVDKTCSPEHAKLLKQLKNNETYAASPSVFIDDSIYRDEKKKSADDFPIAKAINSGFGGSKSDRYTALSFRKFFRKNEYLTNLYSAWAETYFYKNGPVPRRERERIRKFVFKGHVKNVIFDNEIFQNYLPMIVEPNIFLIQRQANFFARFFDEQNLDHLAKLWRKAASAKSSRGSQMILKKYDASIKHFRWQFFKKLYPDGVDRSNREHLRYLLKCEIVIAAAYTNSAIIVADKNDYEQFFDICKSHLGENDYEQIFYKYKNNLIQAKDLETLEIL